jgi:sister-chromatid-cohesion protein PDS5
MTSYLFKASQLPLQTMLGTMHSSINFLITSEIKRHHDNDMLLLVASCLSEIIWITTPKVHYNNDVLNDIFCLIITTFCGLDKINSPLFDRRMTILENVAMTRSSMIIPDLGCDKLILENFHIFFSYINKGHLMPSLMQVVMTLQVVMITILESSKDVSKQLFVEMLTLFKN